MDKSESLVEFYVLSGALLLLFLGLQAFLVTIKKPRWSKPVQIVFGVIAVAAGFAMTGSLFMEHIYFQKHVGATLFSASFIVSSAFLSMANSIAGVQAQQQVQGPTSPPSAETRP